MIEQDTNINKQELLAFLNELIQQITQRPGQDIEKKNIKINLENGTGYLISNKQFHLWAVKLSSFNEGFTNIKQNR